jgi:hypothetical protein
VPKYTQPTSSTPTSSDYYKVPTTTPGKTAIVVDTVLLKKLTEQLAVPADVMDRIATAIVTEANTLTRYGKPPYGDGEIGEAYRKAWEKDIVRLIVSVRNMQYGIHNITGKYGDSAKRYEDTEEYHSFNLPKA